MKVLNFLLLATSILSADCLQEPDTLSVGACYEKEGNTNLAQAAYERAILEDEENIQARIKLAELYQNENMPAQSKALLSNIDNTQLTPQQRTSFTALNSEKNTSLSSFNSRISLSVGYDSNININPIDHTSVTTPEDKIDTLFSRATAELSYMHDLSSEGGWYLRSDADLYYQNNTSAHNFDVLYGRIYAGGGYRSENISIYVPLFYDRLNYLDRDLFQENGLRPDLNIQLSSSLILDINALYSTRRYIQDVDKARDDNLFGTGVGLFWLHARDMAYIKTRFTSYISRTDTAPDFTDKTLYYLMFGGIYSLFDSTDLYADYQLRFGDFKPTSSGHRQDYNHDIQVAIEYDLISWLKMRGQYHFLYNDSNLNTAQYQKNEILLGLVYNY